MDREKRIDELLDEFASTPLDVLTDADQRAICEKILDRDLQSEEEAKADRRAMAWSSVACVILTALTTIPIIVPVLLISDFMNALLAASLTSSFILFAVGYYLGPYLDVNRWITGFTFALITLTISVISVFTGG
jgi:VIT1/CCC1 family predicted Fe2+/Mn2+ transporter